MKNNVIFITALLLLWIAGSSWYYVCKVRNDCQAAALLTQEETQPESVTTDTLPTPLAEVQASPPPDYSVEFETGKSSCLLTDGDRSYLAQIKQYLSENPGKRIVVTGHADNTGSDEINQKLSAQRAKYLRQQLVDAGIENSSIQTAAKSYLEPVADNSTPEGRAKNRRVEIKIN
ncbi:MAG: OmpA family protein [Bacteroidales bacterium]|nr:OmpA family protein [Bacteroidales bacterium]